MKSQCSECKKEEWFIKVVCWDTDEIPHERVLYKCEICGKKNTLGEINARER